MHHLGIFIVGALLASGAMAQGKDSLWEISTKMEMPDMPPEMKGMKIPGFGSAQKQTVCLAEGKKYESEQQKDCKVTDQKTSGKITRMTVQCKDGNAKIEHEQISKDHWRSKMEMTSTRKGQDGSMTMTTEGKRIGACDNEKEGNMSRETQQVLGEAAVAAAGSAAEIGKMCEKAVADWPSSAGAFANYDAIVKQRKDALANAKGNKDALKMVNSTMPEPPGCAKAKVDYCAKSKAAAGEIGSRKGYAAVMKRSKPAAVGEAMRYCGNGDVALVTARHCKAAVADADYVFIADFCPAERKTLAQQHCAGRAYTAVEPKYRALCGGGGDGGGRSYTAEKAAGGSTADVGAAAVEEGVKKLKGLFGF